MVDLNAGPGALREELEALIGTEARWNTANVKALNQLPFPQKDIEAIQEQWRWFQGAAGYLGRLLYPASHHQCLEPCGAARVERP